MKDVNENELKQCFGFKWRRWKNVVKEYSEGYIIDFEWKWIEKNVLDLHEDDEAQLWICFLFIEAGYE